MAAFTNLKYAYPAFPKAIHVKETQTLLPLFRIRWLYVCAMSSSAFLVAA